MKRARGVAVVEMLIYAAVAVAVMGAIAGVIHTWNSYTDGIDQKGYDRGYAKAEETYRKRDNAALQAAITAQKVAEARADKAEADAAKSQAVAAAAYKKGNTDGKAETERRLAALAAGTLKLRDPGGEARPGATSSGTAAPGAPAGAGPGPDGATGTYVSEKAGRFLLGLTGEADDTARHVTRLQDELTLTRALVEKNTCGP